MYDARVADPATPEPADLAALDTSGMPSVNDDLKSDVEMARLDDITIADIAEAARRLRVFIPAVESLALPPMLEMGRVAIHDPFAASEGMTVRAFAPLPPMVRLEMGSEATHDPAFNAWRAPDFDPGYGLGMGAGGDEHTVAAFDLETAGTVWRSASGEWHPGIAPGVPDLRRPGCHRPLSDTVIPRIGVGRRRSLGPAHPDIVAALYMVPGVMCARVRACRAPHMVRIVVAGGDPSAIAEAIAERLPAGIATVGEHVVGIGATPSHDIRISRPKHGSAGACIENWWPSTSGVRPIRLSGRRMPDSKLAVLSMLYDDHPGKHNRNSSQRWMRRFADVAAVAGDALEMGDRALATRVLCEMVPLEEAIKLTRDPVWETVHDSRPRQHAWDAARRSEHPMAIFPGIRDARWATSAQSGETAELEIDMRSVPGPVIYPPLRYIDGV